MFKINLLFTEIGIPSSPFLGIRGNRSISDGVILPVMGCKKSVEMTLSSILLKCVVTHTVIVVFIACRKTCICFFGGKFCDLGERSPFAYPAVNFIFVDKFVLIFETANSEVFRPSVVIFT